MSGFNHIIPWLEIYKYKVLIKEQTLQIEQYKCLLYDPVKYGLLLVYVYPKSLSRNKIIKIMNVKKLIFYDFMK